MYPSGYTRARVAWKQTIGTARVFRKLERAFAVGERIVLIDPAETSPPRPLELAFFTYVPACALEYRPKFRISNHAHICDLSHALSHMRLSCFGWNPEIKSEPESLGHQFECTNGIPTIDSTNADVAFQNSKICPCSFLERIFSEVVVDSNYIPPLLAFQKSIVFTHHLVMMTGWTA